MKPYLTCFLFTLFSLFIAATAGAQPEVQGAMPEKVVVGVLGDKGKKSFEELAYRVTGTDTIYTLTYRNSRKSANADLQTITFSGNGNTLDAFYRLLKTMYAEESQARSFYKVSAKLGDEDLIITAAKDFGTPVALIESKNGAFMLREKNLDKLFGKNKR